MTKASHAEENMAFAANAFYNSVDINISTGNTSKTVLTVDVGRSTEQGIGL